MTGRARRRAARQVLAPMLLGVAACLAAPALAGPQEGYATHPVVAGDTLPSIAARYLRQPGGWRRLQRLNGLADPAALVPGSTVRIPARLLKPEAVAARVEFVRGPGVTSRPGAAGPDAPVAAGASLAQGARIQVPEDGYLRLRLADGSVVRVLAGSDVELRRLRRRNHGASFESIVDVRKGKVESEVAKQPRGRIFEIHAPGAVASVRGTHFDVCVDPDGRVGTAVTEGAVALRTRADAARARHSARVEAGQGLVMASGGQFGRPHALPPAPDLSALAVLGPDAGRLTLDLGPAGLGRHAVRVARDGAFREVLRSGTTDGGRLQFEALDDGAYTVGVRALDADGLAGAEATRVIHVQARQLPAGGTLVPRP